MTPSTTDARGPTLVADAVALAGFTASLAAGETPLALDLETCPRDEWRLRDKDAALSPWRGRLSLISIGAGDAVTVVDVMAFQDPRKSLAELGRIVQRRGLIGHNLLFDLTFLHHQLGWSLPAADRITDTLVLEALLTAGAHVKPPNAVDPDQRVPVSKSLGAALLRHLAIRVDKTQQLSDWGRRPLSGAQLAYAGNDVRHLRPLAEAQWQAIVTFGLERAARLDLACIPVLVAAMVHGVPVDFRALAAAEEELAGRLRDREHVLRGLLAAPRLSLEAAEDGEDDNEGEVLNPRSVPQLKSALERKLGVPVPETNRRYLIMVLRPQAPEVVDALLSWREAASHLGFVRKLRAACEGDGRIHPQFRSQTDTGRITVSRPNLQGLPRSEVIRACIAAPVKRVLVGADYPQIELRLAGWIFEEPGIKSVYLREAEMRARGEPEKSIEVECDIHLLTAARLNGKPPGQISKAERSTAKSASFGVLYGMGAKTLAQNAKVKFGVNLTEAEAGRTIKQWLAAHPVIRRAREAFFRSNDSRTLHECRTILGRRRLLEPGHQASPRYAINSPIQGASADITRLAMVKVCDRLPPRAVLILTVHDELLVECDRADAEAVKAILANAMVEAVADVFPDMPCPVEAVSGFNWAAVK